jgi:hypothetical protein
MCAFRRPVVLLLLLLLLHLHQFCALLAHNQTLVSAVTQQQIIKPGA